MVEPLAVVPVLLVTVGVRLITPRSPALWRDCQRCEQAISQSPGGTGFHHFSHVPPGSTSTLPGLLPGAEGGRACRIGAASRMLPMIGPSWCGTGCASPVSPTTNRGAPRRAHLFPRRRPSLPRVFMGWAQVAHPGRGAPLQTQELVIRHVHHHGPVGACQRGATPGQSACAPGERALLLVPVPGDWRLELLAQLHHLELPAHRSPAARFHATR